tara:strand:+ start:5644 stop:6243 length:600 start_codon:yes stop_codon:yes gene_type:complete
MAITYPLSLPDYTTIRSIDFSAINSVAYSRSPFTFAGQSHAYSGQMWSVDISLKSMRRDNAEKWVAWLISLRGQHGTFLLSDPISHTIRGTATAATITGSAGDNTVSAVVTSGHTFKAGDFFSLGTGSDSTLHKVLEDYTGTGSASDLEIWPSLRKDRTAVSADLTSANGLFRLSSNEFTYSVDQLAVYGISFGAMEAV